MDWRDEIDWSKELGPKYRHCIQAVNHHVIRTIFERLLSTYCASLMSKGMTPTVDEHRIFDDMVPGFVGRFWGDMPGLTHRSEGES